MQVRHVFQVLRGVISEFYVLFPGYMLNHIPVRYSKTLSIVKLNNAIGFGLETNAHNRLMLIFWNKS